MIVLAVGAHSDDCELGCGASLLRHQEAGDEVWVVSLTRPDSSWHKDFIETWEDQFKKASQFREGIYYDCLNFPPVKMNTIPAGTINSLVSKHVESIKPDIIYTHHKGDINIDHRICFEAVMVATRPPQHIEVRCMEVISETEWGWEAFKPNLYVGLTWLQIANKWGWFCCYESEVKDLPHPRNPTGISNLGRVRGQESGFEYAEAFEVIRRYA